MTRFGVILPQHDAGPAELLGAATLAEESGLDSVWVSDHLWGHPGGPTRPMLEGWISLASVAASTRRVTVGTLVTRVSLRNPHLLASMAKTMVSVSDSRLVVALGVGDASNRDEQTAYGIAFGARTSRVRLLEDIVELLREMVPTAGVWIGGVGDDLLRVAARADGWNFWGPAGEFATHLSRLALVAGPSLPEVSWAGSFPGHAIVRELVASGADHLLIAVGAKNFRLRIEQVAEAKSRSA